MKTVIRWILVPFAIVAGWYLSIFVGFGLFYLGMAACPANQISSGMCVAPWFSQYMKGVMLLGPSITATFMILGSVMTAPSHRRIVALLTLAIGAGIAIVLSLRQFFVLPSSIAVVVGSLITWLIWRRDVPAEVTTLDAHPSYRKIRGAVLVLISFAVVLIASILVFKAKIGPRGPKFGKGPFSSKDVPRLIEAVEKRDNAVDAVSALGKTGAAAAPAIPLLLSLENDTDQVLAAVALRALENMGPAAREAIPALRRCAVKDECGRWRMVRESIKTLAGIGDVESIVEAGRFKDYYHEHGVADAVRNYELDGPGLKEVLYRLFQTGSSDYVRESAALGLSRIAPKTPGLVDFFSQIIEKDVRQYSQTKDEGSQLYYANRINEMRKALERIGSPEAQAVLLKFGAPHTRRRS